MARGGPPAYPRCVVSPTGRCWLADETGVWLGQSPVATLAALRLLLRLDPVAVSARALEQGGHQGLGPGRTGLGHPFDVIQTLAKASASGITKLAAIMVTVPYRPAYRRRYVGARPAR